MRLRLTGVFALGVRLRRVRGWLSMGACLFSFVLLADPHLHPKFGFPVYTNKPAGRQMAGQWVAANTPARSPEEQQRLFKTPPGFEVRLFAADPDIANPVAMTWDERGRLWVLELYEYPLGAKPGEKGRDRIKVLEDIDGDGRADTVKVFADGLSLATGLIVGNGGVYVGQAPHVLFMEDTNGDDVADKQTVVLTGFGLEDRHELLNGFTWGPDGQLYMTHGVFTFSKVIDPARTGDAVEPVVLTAGVARFDPRARTFEVFAEGTSNPWGVDFDSRGNAFVSACVIDHLFHLAPGGLYARQAGQPPFPYAYELLPSIVDHKHHMAAYAGVCVYQGDQWPNEWQGEVLVGNIHQNAINQDHLEPNGSSFKAIARGDFLSTTDGWFMPVSTQVGPDGAVWVMDWYDKYPCYQNANADPEGVDREHGRIWRVVWVGESPGKPVASRPAELDLAKASSSDLVRTLGHSNVWHRRMAQRILNGRRDSSTREALLSTLRNGEKLDERLACFWTLYSSGLMDEATLELASNSTEPALRAWAIRFTGERRVGGQVPSTRVFQAAKDPDPGVRSAAATAARLFASGALTIDTPPPASARNVPVGALIAALIEGSKDDKDPVTSFLIWMAAEPMMARRASRALEWFAAEGTNNMPLAGKILAKSMRRLCDQRDARSLDLIVDFLGSLPRDAAPLISAALDGVIEGQRGKAITPTQPAESLISKLIATENPEVVAKAQRLGALWGDAAALGETLKRISDANVAEPERVKAIQAIRQSKAEEARAVLLATVASKASDLIRVEAVRALGEVGNDAIDEKLIGSWSQLSPAARRAVAELLTSRNRWTMALLAAVKRGDIARGDLPPTVIRNIGTHRNDNIRGEAEKILGKFTASSVEKLKLISDKRKVVLQGDVDLTAGHEIATKSCLICHKFHGEGAELGPDLTGVGRSSVDALLHNVINPNELIGQGYENVEVETRDGRIIAGRLMENTDARVRLMLPSSQEEVVSKPEIKEVRVSSNSVMPEGLEQMPDEDFRNMIWYILAPPQDGRALDEERRRELINASPDQATAYPPHDGESVALWNPEWRVVSSPFEGAPARLPEFAGRRNVLMTHPASRGEPAVIERTLDIPAGSRPQLSFWVAAHEEGNWDLRVVADGRLLQKEEIDHKGERWREIKIDLTAQAGKRTTIRLENHANDWAWEFAYWADIRLRMAEVAKSGD